MSNHILVELTFDENKSGMFEREYAGASGKVWLESDIRFALDRYLRDEGIELTLQKVKVLTEDEPL